MLRYPDPQRSKVVLIGTSDYERDDKLSSLPAIRNNLTGLIEALTKSSTPIWLTRRTPGWATGRSSGGTCLPDG